MGEKAVQLTLFEPKEYLLDDKHDFGYFSVLCIDKRGKTKQESFLITELDKILPYLPKDQDVYISQCVFSRPNRQKKNLLRMGCQFVDLDYYKVPQFEKHCPEHLWGYCRLVLEEESYPLPSIVVFSGRGLQLKWLLEPSIPAKALPRWEVVQKTLISALHEVGSDKNCKDASRVLRAVGYVNSKSQEYVRVVDTVVDKDGGLQRYRFEELFECIAPLERPQKKKPPELKVLPKKPSKSGSGDSKGLVRKGSHRLNYLRWQDLIKLGQMREWDKQGVPKGYRSKYVHWVLNFACLLGKVFWKNFGSYAHKLVEEMCPGLKRTKDMESVLSTLFKKAKAYAQGERIEFQGKLYPPLYTPRSTTLIKLFDITPQEQQELFTILGPEEKKRRKKLRNAKTNPKYNPKHNPKRYEMRRSEYEGRAKERAELVKTLISAGLKQCEIAEISGLTKGRVSQIVKSLKCEKPLTSMA